MNFIIFVCSIGLLGVEAASPRFYQIDTHDGTLYAVVPVTSGYQTMEQFPHGGGMNSKESQPDPSPLEISLKEIWPQEGPFIEPIVPIKPKYDMGEGKDNGTLPPSQELPQLFE